MYLYNIYACVSVCCRISLDVVCININIDRYNNVCIWGYWMCLLLAPLKNYSMPSITYLVMFTASCCSMS